MKRVLAVLLALCMILPLAACGEKEDAKKTDAPAKDTPTTVATTTVTQGAEDPGVEDPTQAPSETDESGNLITTTVTTVVTVVTHKEVMIFRNRKQFCVVKKCIIRHFNYAVRNTVWQYFGVFRRIKHTTDPVRQITIIVRFVFNCVIKVGRFIINPYLVTLDRHIVVRIISNRTH